MNPLAKFKGKLWCLTITNLLRKVKRTEDKKEKGGVSQWKNDLDLKYFYD